MYVTQISSITLSIFTVLFTFYTVGKLIIFLSGLESTSKAMFLINHVKLDDGYTQIIWPLATNIMLIGTFILPHSIMAMPSFKELFKKYELTVICRTIYVLVTSLTLFIMLKYWQFVYFYPLWSINANDGVLWWIFFIIHTISWSFIYGGALLMDISELMGIKQVYYNIRKWSDPLMYKSSNLQQLYAHMRHPSFIGFLIIFWFYPVLTLDRALLAVIMTIYMIFAWNPDMRNLEYQRRQLIQKRNELSPENSFSSSRYY